MRMWTSLILFLVVTLAGIGGGVALADPPLCPNKQICDYDTGNTPGGQGPLCPTQQDPLHRCPDAVYENRTNFHCIPTTASKECNGSTSVPRQVLIAWTCNGQGGCTVNTPVVTSTGPGCVTADC